MTHPDAAGPGGYAPCSKFGANQGPGNAPRKEKGAGKQGGPRKKASGPSRCWDYRASTNEHTCRWWLRRPAAAQGL